MRHSDNGNGTFTNPLINGDYPDPDIIRVGAGYYLVSSSFTCAPGIPVCHSTDLVNWRCIGHAYDRLPESNPAYSMAEGQVGYRGGSWAPFIRHRDGRFYIGFCTPAEGFFMCIAEQPEGPYEMISFGVELYDPSLLLDDDGRVYVVHGANGISITELTADARGVLAGPFAIFQSPFGTPTEGSHIYKRNGWYYICLTSRGYNGIQCLLRSRHIMGPYDWRIISADDMNYAGAGLHQGGFVETAEGETWFFMFQDRDYLGRVPILQPARWEDDWLVLGNAGNHGKAHVTARKPALPAGAARVPEAPDEFDGTTLGLQWHWNHNPDHSRWSLAARPGWLRLEAGPAPDFLHARNTLMQKVIGPETSAMTRLDISGLREGDFAGLAIVNLPYALAGVRMEKDGPHVIMLNDGLEIARVKLSATGDVYLRCDVGAEGLATFSHGADADALEQIGEPFVMQFTVKTFLGNRFGLFCYHEGAASGGHADFDYLRLAEPLPAHRFSAFGWIPATAYDEERGCDTQRPTEKRPMQFLINIDEGDWVRYDQVDFGEGAEQFEVVASPIGEGCTIEVRDGAPAGALLGACTVPPNGNLHEWSGKFATYSCAIERVTGLRAICLLFTGRGRYLLKMDKFRFTPREMIRPGVPVPNPTNP